MIASIQGEVIQKATDSLVVVISGMGFLVFVSNEMVEKTKLGEHVNLYTQLIVREDSLTLYGFEREIEKRYFNLLLGVSGIGPKLALAIISTLSIDAINRAVTAEQSEVFSRVSGVGKKNAQKILIHLQGKIYEDQLGSFDSTFVDLDVDVMSALTSLGYSVVESQAAIQSIPKDAPEELEERIRIALQYFS
jgi:Holliday junction DNA helicase RuvA